MKKPVRDGETWREFSDVKVETNGDPVLITPPTFNREKWTADPDAAGVIP